MASSAAAFAEALCRRDRYLRPQTTCLAKSSAKDRLCIDDEFSLIRARFTPATPP